MQRRRWLLSSGRACSRLPLGACSAVVAYFVVAVSLPAWAAAPPREQALSSDFHVGSGFFVGVAGAVVVLVAAVAIRHRELTPLPTAQLLVGFLGGALAATFLLRWQEYGGVHVPVWLGFVEERDGLERIRVPELFRVDRP